MFDIKLNDTESIDSVLLSARKVFKPSKKEIEKYHKKEDWLNKIENNGLLVAAVDKETTVGFLICEAKNNTLHLWNGGVLEDYRKQGIWGKLYKAVEKYAQENAFEKLSLNTYKEKFPIMYKFAQNNGFTEVKNEIDNLQGTTKSYFEKSL